MAALLRRLDPQQPDFDLADALYGEYDDLTAAGAWHGDDAIRTALRSRVERTPEEYGVRDVPPPPPSPYGELLPTGADVFLRRLGELSGD